MTDAGALLDHSGYRKLKARFKTPWPKIPFSRTIYFAN